MRKVSIVNSPTRRFCPMRNPAASLATVVVLPTPVGPINATIRRSPGLRRIGPLKLISRATLRCKCSVQAGSTRSPRCATKPSVARIQRSATIGSTPRAINSIRWSDPGSLESALVREDQAFRVVGNAMVVRGATESPGLAVTST